MKSTELRIGNLVEFDNGTDYELIEITAEDLKHIESGVYFPIPLTSEWLLKMGFEDDSYGNYRKYITEYAWFTVSIDRKTGAIREYVSIDYYEINPPCEYVHQVQNIYYYLTGKELTEQ
jgi:hypothetical protein